MRNIRILAFMLACVLLACTCLFSVSAEAITFKPQVSADKLYGIPAGTNMKQLNNAYYNTILDVYDLDGNRLNLSSSKYIGTGFTIKLNRTPYTAVVLGDVDGDGQIKSLDYIAVKRAYLGTGAKLTALQKQAVGLDSNGELRAVHCLKIKRAILRTYDINNKYTCDPYDPGASESGWTSNWV